MIQIQDLSLTLPGGRELFSNLKWRVEKGEKTGLMGRNGVGKTTLLRLIAGQIEADGGKIFLSPSNPKPGYLAQDLAELPDQVKLIDYFKTSCGLTELEAKLTSINQRLTHDPSLIDEQSLLQERYEQLNGYNFEALALKTVTGLGFRNTDLQRLCQEFSGGWKIRISLACLLLTRPPIMLLDEPTNHLDTESMEWLESWLKSYDGTLVVISHDRHFMDKLITSVAHLDNCEITTFKGNYSHYLTACQQWQEQKQKEAAEKQKQIAHLQSFVDRFRYTDSKAKQAQNRLKMIERLGPVETVQQRQKTAHLRFCPCQPSGKKVLTATNLGHRYDQNQVFSNLNFEVARDEKIAVVGYNGAGKSTLMRLITGKEQPTEGQIVWGHNVQIGSFTQQAIDNLDYAKTVMEHFSQHSPHLSFNERRGVLGKFLFTDDDLNKKIAVLSGGEKSRLALACLTLFPCNLLVLDEPTNHLDAQTKAVFEQALSLYEGTLILISHDRSFLNSLATRIWELREGTLYDYNGNYDRFIELRAAQQNEVSQAKELTNRDKIKEQKRLEGQRRNELYRRTKALREQISQTEHQIEELEQEKQDLETKLCSQSDGAQMAQWAIAHNQTEQNLTKALHLWETLMEQLSEEEENAK